LPTAHQFGWVVRSIQKSPTTTGINAQNLAPIFDTVPAAINIDAPIALSQGANMQKKTGDQTGFIHQKIKLISLF
jgi:xanthine dehydrogenase iron-sulfur cluster and FAD-binding subunit A